MVRPFQLIDSADTPDGRLELRVRGGQDFMISIGGRVLMSSHIHRSETAVAELACADLGHLRAPRVLIGGLGLGFTLRAALDALPPAAHVVVAELNPVVDTWCRGPAGPLTGHAVLDPRVSVEIDDVSQILRRVAQDARAPRFDAVILDLYLGPTDGDAESSPLYGIRALTDTRRALSAAGVYTIWSEEPCARFERRLGRAGFEVERRRTAGGGPRHAVYVARPLPSAQPGVRSRSRPRVTPGRAS